MLVLGTIDVRSHKIECGRLYGQETFCYIGHSSVRGYVRRIPRCYRGGNGGILVRGPTLGFQSRLSHLMPSLEARNRLARMSDPLPSS